MAYSVEKGHGEYLLIKKERGGDYIVARSFDDDEKAKAELTKVADAINKVTRKRK